LKCPYCGSEDAVMNQGGKYVCKACGAALGQVFAPPITTVRVHTVGTSWDFTDVELRTALSEVTRLRHVLNLPEGRVEEAMRLIELAIGGRKTPAVQPEALAAVAPLYGCREMGILPSLRHFTSHITAERRVTKKAVWEFGRLALPQYERAILNASKKFGPSTDVVLELWKKCGRKLVGKNPMVAVVVLICLAKGGVVSISAVSRAVGASSTSVRRTLAQLRQLQS